MSLHQITRVLIRGRSYALAAILTMAVGLAATTAVVAVANAVVLRPLPYLARPFVQVERKYFGPQLFANALCVVAYRGGPLAVAGQDARANRSDDAKRNVADYGRKS
jgi:hypothetical protein